jgi:hypothetical protein
MRFKDHIEQLVRNNGGFAVRVEFLGADGAQTDALGEVVVADDLVSERAFAYVAAGGGRPHGQVIERELWEDEDDGEIVLLPGHRALRLCIGPVWTHEHHDVLARWRATPHAWVAPQLREFFDGLRFIPEPARPVSTRMEFRASFRSEGSGNVDLQTVGAMLLGPAGDLLYTSILHGLADPMRSDLDAACARMPATEVFENLVESGNGITNDWSLPFTVSGPSIEFAAARLMTRLRFEGNPAGHLRELWLSAWPDTVSFAVEEAEQVSLGDPPDDRAAMYLARLRTLYPAAGGGVR